MNEQAWTAIYNAVEDDVLGRHACDHVNEWPVGLFADDVEICARYAAGLGVPISVLPVGQNPSAGITATGKRVLSALR